MYGFWQFAPDPELRASRCRPGHGSARSDPKRRRPSWTSHQDERGQAVQGPSGDIRRKHHHPRHGHPPRTAAGRRWHLQRRGAQGQRPRGSTSWGTSSRSSSDPAGPTTTEVTTTPGTDDQVDIKLKFEEQNRNQISFGAGVSQFDGFFGQLSFQTSNFLGRGETVGVSLQKGSQARQYRCRSRSPTFSSGPSPAGVDLFSREYVFPFQYTQDTTGSNWVFGFPLANYMRGFMTYSYERVD